MDFFKSILRSLHCLAPSGVGKIALLEDGFIVHRPGMLTYILRWGEIEEIIAFKRRDAFADQLNLGFHRRGEEDRYFRADEDLIGFAQLIQEIDRRYQPVDRTWWLRLSQASCDAWEV